MNRLKIYKNRDGSYCAIRNKRLYTFTWSENYKVYNFKKEGGVGINYVPQGKLISNPPMQMILQVQEKIKEINNKIVKESLYG